MTPSLFDRSPEDARPAAKQEGTTKHTDKSTRITPRTPARSNAPATSHAAARRAQRGALSQSVRLLQHLAEQGEAGATNEEAGAALGLRMSSVTARCRGLVMDGLVRDSGRTRPTTSGCAAIVWTLTDAGAAASMSAGAPEAHAAAASEPDAPEGGAA